MTSNSHKERPGAPSGDPQSFERSRTASQNGLRRQGFPTSNTRTSENSSRPWPQTRTTRSTAAISMVDVASMSSNNRKLGKDSSDQVLAEHLGISERDWEEWLSKAYVYIEDEAEFLQAESVCGNRVPFKRLLAELAARFKQQYGAQITAHKPECGTLVLDLFVERLLKDARCRKREYTRRQANSAPKSDDKPNVGSLEGNRDQVPDVFQGHASPLSKQTNPTPSPSQTPQQKSPTRMSTTSIQNSISKYFAPCADQSPKTPPPIHRSNDNHWALHHHRDNIFQIQSTMPKDTKPRSEALDEDDVFTPEPSRDRRNLPGRISSSSRSHIITPPPFLTNRSTTHNRTASCNTTSQNGTTQDSSTPPISAIRPTTTNASTLHPIIYIHHPTETILHTGPLSRAQFLNLIARVEALSNLPSNQHLDQLRLSCPELAMHAANTEDDPVHGGGGGGGGGAGVVAMTLPCGKPWKRLSEFLGQGGFRGREGPVSVEVEGLWFEDFVMEEQKEEEECRADQMGGITVSECWNSSRD